MAYLTKDGKGPYPNKAGEYCGNYNPNSYFHEYTDLEKFCEQPHNEEEKKRHREWLSKMRFGRPRPCKAGTTEEMEVMGWVGLYLKEDSTFLLPGATTVPTPPELMEPPQKGEEK